MIEEPGILLQLPKWRYPIIGFIVEKATGESLSTYVSRRLWTPMHAEEDACGAWIIKVDRKRRIAVSILMHETSHGLDSLF